MNLTEEQKLLHERSEILIRINLIEDIENRMFHEIHPETDTEIHELAWNDRKRLRVIRISLETHYEL